MPTEFIERTRVNGGMLRNHSGENISIMLRVESEAGPNLIAVSTDGHKIRVQLPNSESLGAREGNWVEIIGVPTGTDAIRAKEAILFSSENSEFDEESYNMMVKFLNNCKDIYKSG